VFAQSLNEAVESSAAASRRWSVTSTYDHQIPTVY
jgi:hypothetical protein